MIKKWISLLGATTLSVTSGFAVVSCQPKDENKTKDSEPDPNKIPKKPTTIKEAQELIGENWDLFIFYRDKYEKEENPAKIAKKDSITWQKGQIFRFISDCETHLGYNLGQTELWKFKTKGGNDYSTLPMTWELLTGAYNSNINDEIAADLTDESKQQVTKLYNWATEGDKEELSVF